MVEVASLISVSKLTLASPVVRLAVPNNAYNYALNSAVSSVAGSIETTPMTRRAAKRTLKIFILVMFSIFRIYL